MQASLLERRLWLGASLMSKDQQWSCLRWLKGYLVVQKSTEKTRLLIVTSTVTRTVTTLTASLFHFCVLFLPTHFLRLAWGHFYNSKVAIGAQWSFYRQQFLSWRSKMASKQPTVFFTAFSFVTREIDRDLDCKCIQTSSTSNKCGKENENKTKKKNKHLMTITGGSNGVVTINWSKNFE